MSQQADATRYSLIIEWSDEDGVFIATAPELPGCRTHGATRAEALERGTAAIAEWLTIAADQGWETPAPRIFDGWTNYPSADKQRIGATA